MATYAAYRHVELDNVGYGKKRVLKPPGGGSSDIFGAGGEEAGSPRRVKQNHNASQLGGFFGNGDAPAAPRQPVARAASVEQPTSNGSSAPETPRSKPGNDSYKRLFGPPDARPPSTPNSKSHMRSNISLSSDSASHHNGHSNGYHQNDVVDGNPVTGAGYEMSHHNGGSAASSSASSEKSSTDSSPSVANGPRLKNRVPPGGFSSGLW